MDYPTLDQDVKTKWLDALRSGEYEQGRGRLRTGNQFCCLGVLCDLYRKEVGGYWGGPQNEAFVDPNGHIDRISLSTAVLDWSGLGGGAHCEVELHHLPDQSLSSLNDGLGTHEHSFDEIADVIEAHL